MSLPVTTETVPRPRLDLRVRNVRGTVTVSLANMTYELSETAVWIWKQIDGRNTIADIAAMLAAEFEIDVETATEDTIEVVRDFGESDLVKL
ncbi:PqqD family protein [Catellatospora tritici]|uniref:PqqD family protein n=1 Tax=Catellatospora tritici TaxID=2851566 RepID=UPI001C2CCB6F|nr:PqqD family protein [Catellatospora tritici]MBV1849566.1 PqqD family protein [Catellatospora tritici]